MSSISINVSKLILADHSDSVYALLPVPSVLRSVTVGDGGVQPTPGVDGLPQALGQSVLHFLHATEMSISLQNGHADSMSTYNDAVSAMHIGLPVMPELSDYVGFGTVTPNSPNTHPWTFRPCMASGFDLLRSASWGGGFKPLGTDLE
jgi:hypothetical protein